MLVLKIHIYKKWFRVRIFYTYESYMYSYGGDKAQADLEIKRTCDMTSLYDLS